MLRLFARQSVLPTSGRAYAIPSGRRNCCCRAAAGCTQCPGSLLSYAVPMPTQYTDDLALALRLADAADAISLPRFGAADLQVTAKPDLTPVSDADLAVERAIRSMLAGERPADAIVGEEFGDSDRSPRQPGRPRVGGAGCWTRSTAPRTSSAGCRSGRR